jgi:hypothetical protein
MPIASSGALQVVWFKRDLLELHPSQGLQR